MPELPEVETIAADLRKQLVGRRFVAASFLWPRTLAAPDPASLNARLAGSTAVDVSRRGKYLLIALDSGDTLIIHLRMTGRLALMLEDDPRLGEDHVRARFALADGNYLVFTDARKFGRIWLVRDVSQVLGKLGPEPFDWHFTAQQLGERLAPRRAAIKALLLDQSIIAGLGNIYADEALYLAGIHPLRPGASLTPDEINRLYAAIRPVLAESIAQRGTMLRDYRTPYGPDGAYKNRLRVYGQPGRPCPRCATPIERIRVTQRSTHFCPRCQPATGD
ncbi:MAG: bifunctional DNA-formamidopyrimidine glycosylase/DNA-(apurinic or apyrimidinic site) lyase [Anaerolineae bacterium]|nr:bifunctional DNA-formamidopyrimidine glycosylase/DNA-(apurinic or apyrimidinic site) lyase [Anaerolineae bacterium]